MMMQCVKKSCDCKKVYVVCVSVCAGADGEKSISFFIFKLKSVTLLTSDFTFLYVLERFPFLHEHFSPVKSIIVFHFRLPFSRIAKTSFFYNFLWTHEFMNPFNCECLIALFDEI